MHGLELDTQVKSVHIPSASLKAASLTANRLPGTESHSISGEAIPCMLIPTFSRSD